MIWFYFLAKHNETRVNIQQKFIIKSYDLNESEHVQVNVGKGDYISIEADNSVLVLQYVVPNVIPEKDCKINCGSFMLLVPPMEQQEDQYLFSTLNAAGKQNVNLVITSNLTDGVLLDGQDILDSANISDSGVLPNWTLIDTSSNVNYSAIQFSVDGGLHNLSHHSSYALFVATSYGYPLGMRLQILQLNNSLNRNDIFITENPERSNELDNLQEKYQEKEKDEDKRLKSSTIAVIVSLCSGVFFVIVCIVGFVIAEFVCNSKEPSLFSRGKVAPFNN